MKHLIKILKYTSSLKWYYIIISILSVLFAVTGLITPLLSGKAIDLLKSGSTDTRALLLIVVAIFVLDVFSTIISNISGYMGDVMSTKLQRILSTRYYEHLLELPQSYYDKELSGKIINRLNRSIAQISNFMQMCSNNFLQFVFSTVLALAIIAYFSWPIALLLASLYPIYIFMTIKTSGKWLKYQAKLNKNWDIATGRFAESIGQIKVVKSFVREDGELSYFDKYYKKIVNIVYPQSRHWHVRDVQRRLILNVIFFCVYALIFYQAVNGQFTPGQAVTLILYAMQIRIPIFTVSFLVDSTQKAVADSKDYFEVMNVTPDIKDLSTAKDLVVSKGEISFSNVTFAYDEKPVIKNVTFDVLPDTKIALVGESGEGKTTITNLLMRLYETNEGEILIDGQNIADVKQASLRKQIGAVFQEPALFSGTIKENIAYANPKASIKDIINASKDANAHDFISKLEHGYDSEIGERGLKLSGGQKQRIAIARALLKNAPILILDEATSSLDSKSEQMVQEALKRLMKGRTTLIVAHRLSTIQHVDTIITLKNGKIDEIGSPEKLAISGGIYSQLLNLQNTAVESSRKERLSKFDIAS